MRDDDDAETAGAFRRALPDILGEGVAGALHVGGLDPVTAGALAPALAAVLRLDSWSHTRRLQRAEHVLQQAADVLGGVDELERVATRDDAHLELATRVLEAAARTTLPDKIPALARVLATGLQADTKVDEALILAAALSDLEAPHVLVLSTIAVHPTSPIAATAPSTGAPGWNSTQLATHLPGTKLVLSALVQVLVAHGLIVNLADHQEPAWADVGQQPRYGVSDLGRTCLALLERP